jgi:hypothetical protein
MKLITTELDNRRSYFTSARPSRRFRLRDRIERLLNWLGGIDHQDSGVVEALISGNLPYEIKVEQASAAQLERATKSALSLHPEQSEAIVRFVFASLKSPDGPKAEAVIRSIVSVAREHSLPKLVRIAVRARPSLASTIAATALMLVPEQAEQITSAVESVVTTVSF